MIWYLSTELEVRRYILFIARSVIDLHNSLNFPLSIYIIIKIHTTIEIFTYSLRCYEAYLIKHYTFSL